MDIREIILNLEIMSHRKNIVRDKFKNLKKH